MLELAVRRSKVLAPAACGIALLLVACGGDDTSTPDAGCVGASCNATIATVTVKGRSDNKIRNTLRQHDGSLRVTFIATGTNLANASKVVLRRTGAPDFEAGIIPDESSATQVAFEVPGREGDPAAPSTVEITTPLGIATLSSAIEFVALTVAPQGSDTAGNGTPELPYRSLERAFQEVVEPTPETIVAKAGTYSIASGEQWSTLTSMAFGAFAAPASIPQGVTIRGEGAATVLSGPGDNETVGISIPPGAPVTLDSLQISGFVIGVLVPPLAAVQMSDVSVVNIAMDGLYLRGKPNSLTNVSITGAGSAGISIWDDAAVTIKGGRIAQSGAWGIFSTTTGTLSLEDTELDFNNPTAVADNTRGAMFASGLNFTKQHGPISLVNVNVHDNRPNGVLVGESSGEVNVTITGAQFRRNITQLAGGQNTQMLVRSTTFELAQDTSNECVGTGIYINGSTSVLDLGTGASAGNNTFQIPATGLCSAIYNERQANASTPITMSATTFTNTTPATPGVGCYAATEGRKWTITAGGTCPSTGNVVQVY